MEFLLLDDFVHRSQNIGLLVLLESEFFLFPEGLDSVEFTLELVFLLGTFNEFVNIVSISVKLELNEVFEAEGLALEIDVLLGDSHEFLPMSVQNVFGVEEGNQRQDGVHVLDSVGKTNESLP
jgi:hypothetical protein